jgi:hypothetical protein
MLTIFVPESLQTGEFEVNTVVNGDPKKVTYKPRIHNGHRVLDVPPAFFRTLLSGTDGLPWQRANPEALAWLGEHKGTNTYFGQPFPGAGRPPPVAPIVSNAAPVMVRLRAPAGATSFSHNGQELEIGKDGTITVEDHVADVLRSHGFTRA